MSEANEKNKLTATMNEATAEQDEKKDFVPENPDELYGKLIKLVRENMTENDVSLVEKAYFIAKKAHEGQFRFSGEPYIIHPVSVAIILYNLGMDGESMAAALLHDVVEDTDMTKDNIQEEFGEDVANLVEGVTKLGKVPIFTKEEQQAENVRKMLMAMSQDIRVIIIKLADRIHNMRTLSFMRPDKRREKAQETLEIYAPIAHRLGIRGVKEELEDLAISYLDPVAYKEIRDRLEQQQSKRKEYLDSIQKKISERIKLVVPNASISGRIKSVHGIYRKMYMQGKSFDEIYDIYAVRIIVDDVIDCYNCLGIIHDMFKSIPGRFKDYISTPKANMYQSLHTTVIGDEGIPFEVQIRTWEMHRTAEYGVAAHWKYKLGMSGRQKFEEISYIRFRKRFHLYCRHDSCRRSEIFKRVLKRQTVYYSSQHTHVVRTGSVHSFSLSSSPYVACAHDDSHLRSRINASLYNAAYVNEKIFVEYLVSAGHKSFSRQLYKHTFIFWG